MRGIRICMRRTGRAPCFTTCSLHRFFPGAPDADRHGTGIIFIFRNIISTTILPDLRKRWKEWILWRRILFRIIRRRIVCGFTDSGGRSILFSGVATSRTTGEGNWSNGSLQRSFMESGFRWKDMGSVPAIFRGRIVNALYQRRTAGASFRSSAAPSL